MSEYRGKTGNKGEKAGTKPALPRISRQALNAVMKTLPEPVREHSLRTKRLAAYILERVAAEEWFIATGYKAADLTAAVYYHDIGKSRLPADDLYLTGRPAAGRKARYYSHGEKGLEVIRDLTGTEPGAYRENSFGGALYRAVAEHHLAAEKRGCADSFGERTVTLPGDLSAVCDTYDNLLFVGKGTDGDPAEAAKLLRKKCAAPREARLVSALLEDPAALDAFIGTLTDRMKEKRRRDRYGIRFVFRPVISGADGTERFLWAEPYINDIYYGRIDRTVFLPVAEENDRIFSLEKLMIEHLLTRDRERREAGGALPKLLYRISYRECEKPGFIPWLAKSLDRYGTDRDRFIVGIGDAELAAQKDPGAFAAELEREHLSLALTEACEGNSVLAGLDRLRPSCIVFSEKMTEKLAGDAEPGNFAKRLIGSVNALKIHTVMTGIRDGTAAVRARLAGAAMLMGPAAAAELTEAEFISRAGGAP